MMKRSSSKSGSKIFTADEFSSRGQRFDRLKKSADDENDDGDFSSPPATESDEPSSPYTRSPWSSETMNNVAPPSDNFSNVLMGSLVREEGHIYSLAASGELLFTGSDSKNIRVWKNQREYSGFKSNSGLVKAIVISGDRIFTGHQDGKIRVWRASTKNPASFKRAGTLPTLANFVRCSVKPSNYVEARRHRTVLWIKHFDAISCLSSTRDGTLLYSASWDKTFKVWRASDFRCLESVKAHEDAVNALATGQDGLVFTGSADGTVKSWRRELQGKATKHFFSQTLLKQDSAVTALALSPEGAVLYCGASDGAVNFWERDRSMAHGGVLRGHKLAVLCLATAGTLLFSGSADMGICVWSRGAGGTHACLSVLTGHMGPVKCLAIERDGAEGRWIVYSGSLDKSVKMWRASEPPAPSAPKTMSSAPSFATMGRSYSGAKR